MHAYELFVTLIYNFLIPAKAALYTQLNNHNHPSALSRTANGSRQHQQQAQLSSSVY
jgi:hypothetical protein